MLNEQPELMLPAQCRAARGLLGIDQAQLAELSKVSRNTVADFEADRRVPRRKSVAAMQLALEYSGVVFVPQNGDGPGVRLRFEWARAYKRDNGDWTVLIRWAKGDPLQGASIEDALKAADEAAFRGEQEIATSIRGAAKAALAQEHPRLQEIIERYDRSRHSLDNRRRGAPLSADEEKIAAAEERYLLQVAKEIRAYRGNDG